MAEQINKEKMDAFVKFFNTEVFPVLKGEDGQGLVKLKEIARQRRQELEENKKRKAEGGS